jgi:hypothetical protein
MSALSSRAICESVVSVLFATCAWSAPAAAQDVIPPKAYTVTPGGINVADRSLVYSETDLSVGPLTLERFHRSGQKQPNDPPFGANFSNNFDIYVAKRLVVPGTADKVIVHLGQSASGTYVQNKSTNSITAENLDAEKGILSLVGGKYVYTDGSGTVYTFSATVAAVGLPFSNLSRKIERIDFPDGRVQTFSYNGSGYLKLIEDTSGYAMVFDYNGNGDVTAACAFNRAQNYVSAASTCAGAQLKTSYAYTTINSKYYLTSATDVSGNTTTYTNVYGGVTCIKPPGFASCSKSMTLSAGQVFNQSLADGGTWTIYRSDSTDVSNPDEAAPYDGHNEIEVVDPAGKSTQLTFTKTSPYSMVDANGAATLFKFEGGIPIHDPWAAYSYGSMLREAQYPEGDKYLAEYNGPFRAISKETHVPKPGSGLPNLVKTYAYGPCASPGSYKSCGKPAAITDPKGNVTNFTYDPAHGGVLTEMKPAPAAGGARPLTAYTYAQKYAYVKNSGGALVAASTPVWVPATMTVCQTVAGASPSPVCDGGALQTVTTYEYGANGTANNLLVRGIAVTAGGQTLRTCSAYDTLGRKISETQPNANLTSCP